MEPEKKKTFIPYPGDWMMVYIQHRDGYSSGHVGKVVKRDHGYFTGFSDHDPIVFDEEGNIEPQVINVEVIRNHEVVFSSFKITSMSRNSH